MRYKLKHIFSWSRIKMFILDEIRARTAVIKPIEAIAFSEMVLYRSQQCPACTTSWRCVGDGSEGSGCGCKVPSLYTEPAASCELHRWSAIDGDDLINSWDKYKKLNNIEIVSK